MDHVYKIGEGYLVSVAILRWRLAGISGSDGIWELMPARKVDVGGEIRPHAAIRHTNPWIAPNEPSFLFPIAVQAANPEDEGETLVLIHAGLIFTENDGIYWERDSLKFDCLQDFFYFWPPLHNLGEHPKPAIRDHLKTGQ